MSCDGFQGASGGNLPRWRYCMSSRQTTGRQRVVCVYVCVCMCVCVSHCCFSGNLTKIHQECVVSAPREEAGPAAEWTVDVIKTDSDIYSGGV